MPEARRRGSGSRIRLGHRILLLACVAVLVGATGWATESNAHGPGPRDAYAGAAATPIPPPNWPEVHEDPQLTGYTTNSTLSTANASELGVKWAADLYGAALDSPVTAYDPQLGMTLVYVGTESGNVMALNEATGQIVWGKWLGSEVRSVPVVSNGSVYVATFSTPAIYRLNATTGDQVCRLTAPRPIEGSPTLVTPLGGVPTLYVGSNDDNAENGPFLAMNADNCSLEWTFSAFKYQTTGSWDSVSYGVDAAGTPLVLFGTADPDSGVYALNALTGSLVWRFQSYNPSPGTYDVGAGAVVTPPGTNGFLGGVAYVPSKYGIFYALNLTSGSPIWAATFDSNGSVTETGRSTAAIDGTTLVVGNSQGLVALDALNGAILWRYHDPAYAEILSSPAIVGPSGHEVAVAGDTAGSLDVVSLSSGTQLYRSPTGGYITASPAISGGNVLIASSDGFLFDYAVGGGNAGTLPATSITSPVAGAVLPNPDGDLTLTGTALSSEGVVGVNVAIESDSPSGPWWDATTQAWVDGPFANRATLAIPGGPSTAWSFAYPLPTGGGTYQVHAYAIGSSGQSDLLGASVAFSVNASTAGPHLRLSSAFVAPGASFSFTGGGFGRRVKVEVSLDGKSLASITSAANGSLPRTSVKVPTSTAFGLYAVNASASSTGATATAHLTIANNWEEQGYDSNRTGYEPYDPVLNTHVQIAESTWLDVAWEFAAGAAINASPVVVHGVVYVVDTAGQLFALDNENGGLLWEWTLPSQAALVGSPAADPALGLVIVAGADGSVSAVSTSSGQTVWSTSVPGLPTAPTFASGEVYLTSSAGIVECLSESGGVVSWERSLGDVTLSPVSLDTAHADLIVGESNGNLLALNASDGATRWTFSAGSSVRGAPLVYDRTIFFGTLKGVEYAVSEITGASTWSYRTGSSLNASGTLVEQGAGGAPALAIGADRGTMYLLRITNGKLDSSLNWTSPIVGLGSTDGIVVGETARGVIDASRAYATFNLWSFRTGAGLCTAPVIVDSAIYVGASDGTLYVFTTFGQAPD